MRLGLASDHGGFDLKHDLAERLRTAGYHLVDFGSYKLDPNDDYPDFVIPLAEAVSAAKVDRGIAICGSGVGASFCASKVGGARAALIGDVIAARQGVENDDLNIICLDGRTIDHSAAWRLLQEFLSARFSPTERHLRRLDKVASMERAAAQNHDL